MENLVGNDDLLSPKATDKLIRRDGISSSEKWPCYHRRIHVYETDKDGVVHFSNYLRIAEEAMFNGFRETAIPFDYHSTSVAMIRTQVDYYHPIKFGDRIDISLVDLEIKRVKFSLIFEFHLNTLRYAKIKLDLVRISVFERKAMPFDNEFRRAMAGIRL